ncbi:SDR family oxidoreductase [Actinophytocola sp.]|uniref:SDR family oxidoreductase n=1 Tax=Actinophytocola sp. TaxID=1872138 RepID=UPI003D6C0987
MTILVTGATGQVGRQVVAQLSAAGERVRAMSRRPFTAPAGVETVRGDLLEPASLPFDGVTAMYLFPQPRTARAVVEAAVAAGVRRIVTLSSGAVSAGLDTDYQLPVEQAVEASGCEWTHLRPGQFASNTLKLWGPSIRAERVVRYHHPDWRGLPIHEADTAAVGVAALLSPGHHGRAYDLTGPERLSAREQVRAISAALGEDVRFEEVTPGVAGDPQAAGRLGRRERGLLTGFEAYSPSSVPELTAEEWDEAIKPLPTVEEVTGRPPRTYAEWARDHVEDFR